MSESAKPKLRWHQMRLTTAVLLMFAAGGLIWSNSVPRLITNFDDEYKKSRNTCLEQGWPMTFWIRLEKLERLDPETNGWTAYPSEDLGKSAYSGGWFKIVVNCIIAGITLLLVWRLFERLQSGDWTALISMMIAGALMYGNLYQTEAGEIGWPIRYEPCGIDLSGGFAVMFFVWPINVLSSLLIYTAASFGSYWIRNRNSEQPKEQPPQGQESMSDKTADST